MTFIFVENLVKSKSFLYNSSLILLSISIILIEVNEFIFLMIIKEKKILIYI